MVAHDADPTNPDSKAPEKLITFYLYAYGCGLSLVAAMVLGHGAKVFAAILRKFVQGSFWG